MTGVIEGFRWALVGGPPPGAMTIVSALVVAFALASGLVYFRSAERTFADII
jgi:lipopolysaccharide transport system permease protein